jgi:cytochrome P450
MTPHILPSQSPIPIRLPRGLAVLMLYSYSMLTMITASPVDPVALALLLAALTGLYLAWYQLRRNLESKKPYDNLPMPSNSHFLWGHQVFLQNREFQQNNSIMMVDHGNEYGQTGFWLWNMPAVSITDWRDARAILRHEYQRRRVFFYVKHFNMFLGSRNIGILQGREWKLHRAAVLRSFAPARVKSSKGIIAGVTQTLIQSIRKRLKLSDMASPGTPLVLDIEPIIKMIAIDIFGKVAFSTDLDCSVNLEPSPVAIAFDFLGQDLARRMAAPIQPTNFFYSFPTRANRQHHQARTLLRSFLAGIIQERRGPNAKQSSDLLAELLANAEGEDPMSDQAVLDTLLALLFAGYDTTSITLTYALYQISQYPAVEDLLLQEINRASDNLDNTDQLVYVQGVLHETLRLFPPAIATARFLQKSLQLRGGFEIPEQSFVVIPIWLIQREAKNFPEPESFRPDRWVKLQGDDWVERLEGDDFGSIAAANRGAFFAFSAGARSCAGSKFAMQEATLVLAGLLKAFSFRAIPGYELTPVRSGIVQHPKGGIPMTINVR